MFKIFNQKLAGFLMLNGLPLRGIEPNERVNGYNIFIFDSSKAASKAIDDFQSYKKALEKGEESK